MPRTTRASGSSHAHLQNQLNIEQRDEPITHPLPEQRNAQKSSRQPPIGKQGKRKDNIHSLRLQKELSEKELRKSASKWREKFQKYLNPIWSLEEKLDDWIRVAQKYSQGIIFTNGSILKEPQNKEILGNLLIQRYAQLIKHSENLTKIDGVQILEPLSSELESFNSLRDKDELCGINSDLKELVNAIQESLAKFKMEEARASTTLAHSMMLHDVLKHKRTLDNCDVLEMKMAEGNYSESVRSDIAKMIAEFDEWDKSFMKIIEKGNKGIEAYDKLLADPHSNEALKNEAKILLSMTQCCVSAIFIPIANNAESKIRLLISLLMHDNSKQQGYEDLKKWHESIKSLMVEYHSVANVNLQLMKDEEPSAYANPDRLSQNELLVRLQAATEGPYQFEKIIRTCEKRAVEYDNLKQVAKDERLTPLLKEMAAKVTDCMRNREYAAQMWSDKIRELERKKSAQASFLPSSSSQPVQRKMFHRTTEGVVVGSINQKGGLDSLNEAGKIISTYFKDEDSGDWVRDYSDESEPAGPAQSTEPAAPQKKMTAREKAERIVQKALDEEEKSKKFSKKARADVAASRDYDDKADRLRRAVSKTLKAMEYVNVALVNLPKAQAGDPSGEDLSVTLKDAMTRLLKDKRALNMQLNQTVKDGKLHFLKVGPPNGKNFKALQEESQVASIVKELERRQNLNDSSDWLDRYVISFVEGPQNEQYAPWAVHVHYNAPGADAPPARVHMKYHAQKDWGKEMNPYHSPPLSEEIFNLVKQGVQPPLP